jgi:hypothetical protein
MGIKAPDQRFFQPALNKALAHTLNGSHADIESLGDFFIRPSGTALSLIGLEQDVGVLAFTRQNAAFGDDLLQHLALGRIELDDEFLGHQQPPQQEQEFLNRAMVSENLPDRKTVDGLLVRQMLVFRQE